MAPQVGVSELSVSRRAIGLAALPLFEEEAARRTGGRPSKTNGRGAIVLVHLEEGKLTHRLVRRNRLRKAGRNRLIDHPSQEPSLPLPGMGALGFSMQVRGAGPRLHDGLGVMGEMGWTEGMSTEGMSTTEPVGTTTE